MGAKIGGALLPGTAPAPTSRPAYLAKRAVASGVWQFKNEQALIDQLERRGIEIISPEKLSLPEQIDLLQSRPVILPLGSAHHVTALCTRVCNLMVVAQDNIIPSNFRLIDQIKETKVEYLFPSAGMCSHDGDEYFQAYYEFLDPVEAAEETLSSIYS